MAFLSVTPFLRVGLVAIILTGCNSGGHAGDLKWRHKTGGEVFSGGVVAADGTVFIGSSDGFLYSLDGQNGSLQWRFQTADEVQFAPVLGANDTVLVSSFDGCVYAVHVKNGSLKWRYETNASAVWGDSRPYSPKLGANGDLVLVATQDVLLALHTQDGSLKWRFSTESISLPDSWLSPPARDADGTLYVSFKDGLLALREQDASLKWNVSIAGVRGSLYNTPTVSTDGFVYVPSASGDVVAVHSQNGSFIWKYAIGCGQHDCRGYTSLTMDVDGTVFVSAENQHFYALAGKDGSLKWSFEASRLDPLQYMDLSKPAVSTDGTVYVSSATHGDNCVYAVKAKDGTLKWRYETNASIYSSPTVGPDGTVFIGSIDTYVYALQGKAYRKDGPITSLDSAQTVTVARSEDAAFGVQVV